MQQNIVDVIFHVVHVQLNTSTNLDITFESVALNPCITFYVVYIFNEYQDRTIYVYIYIYIYYLLFIIYYYDKKHTCMKNQMHIKILKLCVDFFCNLDHLRIISGGHISILQSAWSISKNVLIIPDLSILKVRVCSAYGSKIQLCHAVLSVFALLFFKLGRRRKRDSDLSSYNCHLVVLRNIIISCKGRQMWIQFFIRTNHSYNNYKYLFLRGIHFLTYSLIKIISQRK